MKIAIPTERRPHERRVAATPDTVKRFVQLGVEVCVEAGAGEPLLRALLTPGAHPQSLEGLEIVAEADRVEWITRLHDRSEVKYDVHIIAVTAD